MKKYIEKILIDDKYYKKYNYLFNYSYNKFNLINQYILYNHIYKNQNICNIYFINSFNKQLYNDIIQKKNLNYRQYIGFNFTNFIFKNNKEKKLIITNNISNIRNLLFFKNCNFDIILYYNQSKKFIPEINRYINEIKEKINNTNILYSSYDLDIYKHFLINLKNNNEENNISIPKHKYELISCNLGYILGLGLTANYKMTLEIPNIISSIVMALKNIEKNGTLLLFWTIVNINIPIIKKILSILSYGFKNVEIIDNDINQNLLIGVPEYYIKCSGYKDNISNDLINKLLDIAIETVDYTYDICDILDYYDDYTEKNPNHSLFYNKIDEDEKIHKLSKKEISQKSSKSKEIKPIYYIEDINIPELDDIMKDSQLQYKVSTLSHKLESIFIGYFEMVNNYILNAIDTDSKGDYFVKPQAIKQKDITNLTKLINMFEYNKLPYNKHALSVVLEKKDDYTNYLYGLNNTIDTTLVKYNDTNTSKLNKSALDNLELFNPYSSDASDASDSLYSYTSYIDKVSISNKVKSKLLEDIEETNKTSNDNKYNDNEQEALEDEKQILNKLTKGLGTYIKLDIKPDKIPITVKDFLSLASTIKTNLGINEFAINNTNDYKVGFIVRENNRILYDHGEKVKHNKDVYIHTILKKELQKLNIPFKTTSFDTATFEEQAEFLKDVKILIACHGAAFTNLFLLPKNATIMEVSFRRYWYCDPVCQCHVSRQCPYKKDCHTISDSRHYNIKTKKLEYHKADYYNLSQLFGIGYKEILIEDASGYFKNPGDKDYNPINLTNIYIDTNAMIDQIKKLY